MPARTARRLCSALAVAAALAGCGGTTENFGAICDATASISTCYDYSGALYTQDMVEALCHTGKVGTAPCPSAHRVGTCKLQEARYLLSFYSTGGTPYTTEAAQARCTELGGQFTAG